MARPGRPGPGTRRLVLTIAAASSLALGACGAPAAEPRPPVTHTVRMSGTSFVPAELTVAVGDHVRWVNEDNFPHTATSADRFDSGTIGASGSWTYTAAEAGTFDYVCSFHPTMTGTLLVRGD